MSTEPRDLDLSAALQGPLSDPDMLNPELSGQTRGSGADVHISNTIYKTDGLMQTYCRAPETLLDALW